VIEYPYQYLIKIMIENIVFNSSEYLALVASVLFIYICIS